MKYFDDFQDGEVYDLGVFTLSVDDIKRFAAEFDRQPFHLDDEFADTGPFGGLIASGFHTASLYMQRYSSEILADSACAGSPGIDDMRFVKPIRPGITYRCRLTVLATRKMSGRPDHGLVDPLCEIFDPEGNLVFSMVLHSIFKRRPYACGDHGLLAAPSEDS